MDISFRIFYHFYILERLRFFFFFDDRTHTVCVIPIISPFLPVYILFDFHRIYIACALQFSLLVSFLSHLSRCVCVIRWVSNGDFVSDANRDIYIDMEKKERGVGLLGDNEMFSGILSHRILLKNQDF